MWICQYGTPITFGLKIAVFASETDRHLVRLEEAEQRICVGKMSGVVGTGAAMGPKALEIQDILMKDLGINAEPVATQLVGRDRYVEFVSIATNIAASLERSGTSSVLSSQRLLRPLT